MTQVSDKVLAWLYNVLQEYRDPRRTYSDSARTLSAFPSLTPRTEVYTHENGSSALLLTLSGTLPIDFRGSIYHFPIKAWIPQTYPQNAPIVFVNPARDMLIRPGQHVGVDGRVYHTYLRDWNKMQDRASISECLDYVQQVFAKEPPVISKAHQQQYQQRTISHQSSPGHGPSPPRLPPKPNPDSKPPVEMPTSSRPMPPPKPPKVPDQERQQLLANPRDSAQAGLALARFTHEALRPQLYDTSPSQVQGPDPVTAEWRGNQINRNYQFAQSTVTPESSHRNEAARVPNVNHGSVQSVNGYSTSSQHNGSAQDIAPITPHYHQSVAPQRHLQRRAQSPVSPVSPVARLNEQAQWQYSHMPSSQYTPQPTPYQPLDSSQRPSQPRFSAQYQNSAQHFAQSQHNQAVLHPAITKIQAPPDLLSDTAGMTSPDRVVPTSGSAPPIPPNPEKEHLLHALSMSLVSQAQQKLTQNLSHLRPLKAQEHALHAAHARLDSEIQQLEHLSRLLESNESILHRAVQDCETTIKSAKSKPQPPIDEVLMAPTLVAQQLWTLSAEEAACREAMYVLQKALDQGRISGEVFVRQMRNLGRECFLKMTLVRKCARGLGLEVQGR